MKGYKGTDKDMKCRGYQYELGKTYKHKGDVEICMSGFHFCRNLSDVFYFYDNNNGNRFFEVEIAGAVKIGINKCVASEITFLRELGVIDVNRAIYGYGYGNGYGYGYGDGYGKGYGKGYGYDDGNGDGYGKGDGNGDGNGYGYGNGDGNGDGKNIQKILIFREVS